MNKWQVSSYLEGINGALHMDGANLCEIVKLYDTPLFVFSERRIENNIAEIASAFKAQWPKSSVFYASKANSNMGILRVIKESGINIEVNSGGELFKALEIGFRPNQIIFNGVAKTKREIREAVENRIFCINVDSACELKRILAVAVEVDVKANIALRIVPEVKASYHGGLRTGTYETKFGISDEDLLGVYQEVLSRPDQLNLVGLHMHIGSQTPDPMKFKNAFENLARKASEIHKATGHIISHLNIGGGIPVSYIKEGEEYLRNVIVSAPEQELGGLFSTLRGDLSPIDVARATVGQLRDSDFIRRVCQDNGDFRKVLEDICIAVEPGRRVIGDAAVLLTTIQSRKDRKSMGDTWLMLDAGFNTLLEAFDYNWYFYALAAEKLDNPHDYPYRLAGPLCDSGDVFFDIDGLRRLPSYRLLPSNMQSGDLIAFLDVGAYTLEQMSQYNGQPRAGAILVRKGGSVTPIRRRDTYEDLISHDIFHRGLG
ncbi:MAG: hypothetical protein FJZ93_05640 [Chloroflexi bacterium]|nr:hypothetical protein [Chloroflexota bacterium]